MYLILPCFDWIGFHLCQKLLQRGDEVIGIGEPVTAKQDNFWAFLARNSSFHLYGTIEEFKDSQRRKSLAAVIELDGGTKTAGLNANHFILSRKKQDRLNSDECFHIELPMLYGEWMPRSQNSFPGQDGGTVLFNSEEFRTEAVYIEDFCEELLPLLEEEQNQPLIICPAGKEQELGKAAAKIIPVIPRKEQEQRMKRLDEHYEKYQPFY
ncbi:hypothetical protein [Virgibacillus senegalensis]|uniref:hypothetical protein n=1 Tax=Virgibacillus senegalensis TaxID=1499679 RepID=UPI00069D8444|nr:hypothetical protein [Virgibacillus senegalensis]